MVLDKRIVNFFSVLVILLALVLPNILYARNYVEVITKADGWRLKYNTERKIERGITYIYTDFKKLLGLGFRHAPTVRNTIFGSREQYMDFAKRFNLPISDHSGFYTERTNTAYTWKQSSDKDLMSIMMHESTHRLIARKFPRCPIWLNEGLASYYEGIKIDDNNNLKVNPITYRSQLLKKYIEGLGDKFDLEKFVNYTRGEFYRDSDNSYNIGWSLVYYMMSSISGRKVIAAINENVKQRIPEQSTISQVIDKNYHGGIESFKNNWLAWLKQKPVPLNVTLYY